METNNFGTKMKLEKTAQVATVVAPILTLIAWLIKPEVVCSVFLGLVASFAVLPEPIKIKLLRYLGIH